MSHLSRLTARLFLVCALWCSPPGVRADELRIGGTGSGLGTMQLLANAFMHINMEHRITILPSMGSKGGIKAVVAGAIDLAVSSRQLTPEEMATGASATPYGRTPLVLAVAGNTRHTAISSQQLVNAYAGQLVQWPDGTRIRLILRPVGDADTELIKAFSPAMREAATLAEQRKGMVFAVTDQEAADHLEKVPGALGPLTLTQILTEKRTLKALSLDGVMPEVRNLANNTYPLYKDLLFVTGTKPAAVAQSFMAFVRSPAGRAVLVQTGHWVP
jgi:phosphate transport system substrate-binding protein